MRIGLLAMVVLLCASCGPAGKLRRAQRLIDKAIADGAKVKNDTTWTDVKFVAPPMSFSTTLSNPNWSDTLILRAPGKDSIVVKIKRTQVPGGKEVVYVEADCPPQAVQVPCPTVVEQTISAGYTLWDLIILAIICLLFGTFMGPVILRSFSKKKD